MANLLGRIELADFNGLAWKPTQKAASAWAAFDGAGLVGASYRPLLYCGEQVAKGTTHWFIAEQTMILAEPERHIVKLAVNEFTKKNDEGELKTEYQVVPHSIEIIF